MSKKKNNSAQKQDTKELIAELHEAKAEDKTVSEVATLKQREVKLALQVKDDSEIKADKRLIVSRDMRSYMCRTIDKDHAEVANTTFATLSNSLAKKVFSENELKEHTHKAIDKNHTEFTMSQSMFDRVFDEFRTQQVKLNEEFVMRRFREAYNTWGSAFGNTSRTSLFKTSILVSEDALKSATAETIAKLKAFNAEANLLRADIGKNRVVYLVKRVV